MPLIRGRSMEYKPAHDPHTPIVFTMWEYERVMRACELSGNFRQKETSENFRDGRGGDVFEKTEGYKNRTRPGSWPSLTLLFLHSELAFFNPKVTHLSVPSPVTTLASICLSVSEQRFLTICLPGV